MPSERTRSGFPTTARGTGHGRSLSRAVPPYPPLARGRVAAYREDMAEWWSVEVFHGAFSAARWRDSYGSSLIESAVSHGALDWEWHEHRWGVVFEVAFGDDAQWEAFRGLPGVRAALDAVPDPVNGLLVYRGRGGGAGALSPRRPRPYAGAGAMALPEPEQERHLDLTGTEPEPLVGVDGGPGAYEPVRVVAVRLPQRP